MKMINNRHHLAILIVAFAFTLVLSGCGATSSGNATAQADNGAVSEMADGDVSATTDGDMPETTDGNVSETTDGDVPATTDAASPEETDADTPVFNSETLAAFDGQDGNPAYVAINGVVYDVTDVPNWRGGLHNGNTAGKDLTSVLGRSPHGETVLKDLPVVGTFE